MHLIELFGVITLTLTSILIASISCYLTYKAYKLKQNIDLQYDFIVNWVQINPNPKNAYYSYLQQHHQYEIQTSGRTV